MTDTEKEPLEIKHQNGHAPAPVGLSGKRGSIAFAEEGRKILEHSHDADEAMKVSQKASWSRFRNRTIIDFFGSLIAMFCILCALSTA